MNEFFLDYSSYYDLLYKDKNYGSEAGFVIDLIQKECPGAKKILNIGCGTGKHDPWFVEAGFTVTGIDVSAAMLEIAKKSNIGPNYAYLRADARSFRSETAFDAVVSLFHVFSYQTSNSDAIEYLKAMRAAIKTGGIGIFDFWYAPAVIHQKPEIREKRVKSADMEIIRNTKSSIDYRKSIVNVEFDIKVRLSNNSAEKQMREIHPMRYFSCNEIDLLCSAAGLEAQHFAWMSDSKSPGIEDWSAYSIVKPI
jgi:SAM-dependent methyltransferase